MSTDFIPEDFTGHVPGLPVPTFEGFVESCLFALRNAVVLQGRLPIPMFVVGNTQSVRPIPSPGGTLRSTIPWVREQATEHGATWVFIAIEAPVGWQYDADQFHDMNSREKIDEIPLENGVFYYAGSRTGSYFLRKTGIARFIDGDLSPIREAPADQPVEIFDSVLS